MPVPDRLNSNTGRPLKPTLASTRTAKTPVTPRLASSVAPASSAPAARTVRSNVGTTPRASTPAQEDLSTPIKSFLNHNITPRSSSRKSRVGTGSPISSPIAAPSSAQSNTRPASTIDFGQREQTNGNGLGLSGWNGPRVAAGGSIFNATPTPKPTAPGIHNYNYAASEVGGSRGGGAMFFHASDVRPQETAPPPKKTPAFFYVNGQQDDSSRGSSEAPSPPLSSVGRPKSASKFFHADSIPDSRGPSPILPQQPPSVSPEPWPTVTPLQQSLPPIRPPSPSRENNNIHPSYRKGASQVIRPNLSRGPSALSNFSGSHASNTGIDLTRRKSSTASSVRFGHSKSASLSSIDSVTSLRKGSMNDGPPIAPSPLNNERRAVSNKSLPEEPAYAHNLATELSSGLPTELLIGLPSPGLGHPSTGLQSPTKASPDPGALARMNELAANARRERKVLDLEISNSSLLAINRSLEREVRKQKAELRRFRRMSRAGRFSMDTISSDPESFSAIGVDAISNLSDMSEGEEVKKNENENGEEEEEEEVYRIDEEEYEVSDESSLDEGAMSPTTLAARDAAHLEKDEKRLQLDLSKHQELLLDSQKMNQSLKRCMNWTEELIKEGQKALAYKVHVSDVKLGGRVLVKEEQIEADDDDEDIFRESRGLLSPWTPSIRGNDPFDSASIPDSERTDRDSGVDLEGLKSLPGLRAYVSPLGSPMSEMHPYPRLSRQFEGMDETY